MKNEVKTQFSKLLDKVYLNLQKRSMSLTKNYDDANDLLQDTMIKSYEKFSQFAPGTNFGAWIFRIMYNTFISEYRRTSNRPTQIRMDDASKSKDFYRNLKDQKEWEKDFEISGDYFDDRLSEAIEKLCTNYKKVIIYRVINNFSYLEIAKSLNMPTGTVMSNIYRARKQLRFHLTKKNDETLKRK